ncbi:MAG: TonB-dependent receptor [Bacteroidota bacterium]
MIRTVTIFFYCVFGIQLLNAQVTGMVKDASSLTPVENVHVVVISDSTKGTFTDSSGVFNLEWYTFPITIGLTAIGYESQTFELFEAGKQVTIFLKPESVGMEEIVIFSNRDSSPLGSISSISKTTISPANLYYKPTTTGIDALRAEQGVFVQQTSVGQGSVYIRGRAGRDVLYLFNGLRLNPSFIRSGQNQYFGVIDPLLFEQMDIYRGPISLHYGSDALSGGLNLTPYIPDLTKKSTTSGSLLTSANLNGNGEQLVHGRVKHQSENASFFVGGSFRDIDFYRMSSRSNDDLWFPYDEHLSNADYQFASFSASGRIKVGNQAQITGTSYFGEIPGAPRFDRMTMGYQAEEEVSATTPRSAYYSNTEPLQLFANTLEYAFAPRLSSLKRFSAKMGYVRLLDHRTTTEFDPLQPPSFSISDALRDPFFQASDTSLFEENESRQWHASLDALFEINPQLFLKTGGDISYDQTSSARFNSVNDAFLPRFPDNSTFTQFGVFLQFNHRLFPKLIAEYGLRYSHFLSDIPFENSGSRSGFTSFSDHTQQLTGALGLRYSVRKNLQIVSNISNGFRAPNISDLSEVGSRGFDQFQAPNQNLSPEKTLNFDLGMRMYNDAVQFELVGFWLHYFDKIEREETGQVVNDLGESIGTLSDYQTLSSGQFREVLNQNISSMNILGIEYRGDIKLSTQLSSGLTFSYTWGEIMLRDGLYQPVNRIPPANGLLFIQYQPRSGIILRPQIRYAFAQRRISPEEVEDVRVSEDGTDGFANLQFSARVAAHKRVTLNVLADNIADVAYREHASSLDGMGRNVTISVNYAF